jgi:hypothetical protein
MSAAARPRVHFGGEVVALFDGGAAGLDFVPAGGFGGARPGYAFKRGAEGLGYYRDPQAPPATPAGESAAATHGAQSTPRQNASPRSLPGGAAPARGRGRPLEVKPGGGLFDDPAVALWPLAFSERGQDWRPHPRSHCAGCGGGRTWYRDGHSHAEEWQRPEGAFGRPCACVSQGEPEQPAFAFRPGRPGSRCWLQELDHRLLEIILVHLCGHAEVAPPPLASVPCTIPCLGDPHMGDGSLN